MTAQRFRKKPVEIEHFLTGHERLVEQMEKEMVMPSLRIRLHLLRRGTYATDFGLDAIFGRRT